MADKLKLLIITHNYPRNESDFAGIFIAQLAKKLLLFNIQPIILAPHDTGAAEYEIVDSVIIYRFRYADNETDQNIAYRGNMHQLVLGSVSGIFKFKHFLDCWRKKACEIIEKEDIKVIAGHWLIPSGLVLKSLKKRYNLPQIMSSHGTDIRLMRKYFKVVYRYLKNVCADFSSWTVVSSFLRDGILDMDSSLSDIIKVLPLPHDESIFYLDENISRAQNRIVSVTRFTDQKRVDKLIIAFALLSEKNRDAMLHIIGKGPLKNEILTLIQKFGLNDRVTIDSGLTQSQLREVYSRATMVVLNSFEEGFGLALSEAMLCGAPVIGTNSGGIKDIIRHNETGLLVELDNVNDLSEAMLTLLADRELAQRLAESGYKFAVENYRSDKLAEKYAELVFEASTVK